MSAIVLLLLIALHCACCASAATSLAKRLAAMLDAVKYTCDRPLDVVFLLDGSGSVDNAEWDATIDFVADFSGALEFGVALTRMGVVQFSDAAQVAIPLTEYNNQTDFAAAARGQPRLYNGGTKTYLGVEAAAAHIASAGRAPEAGAAHMIITITDGQSDDAQATNEACDAAWEAGSTMALITIGFQVNPIEREGFTRNNTDLDFPLEDWDGIEADGELLFNLTALACSTPIVPDNLTPINTTLPCNSSLLVVFYPNVTGPLNLIANIANGSVIICFSYTEPQPSPAEYGVVPGVECSFITAGREDIATITAFPNSTDGAGAGGAGQGADELTLFVSVTSGPGDSGSPTDCGGAFTLEPYYCSVELAVNVTSVIGNGTGLFNFNTTWIGNPLNPKCSSCPDGTARMSTDPSNPLYGICASACAGLDQFVALDVNTGVETCKDCPDACMACAAPGQLRDCSACPLGDDATGGLLLNSNDPALQSPFWDQYGGPWLGAASGADHGSVSVATADAVHASANSTRGRCLLAAPPQYGYASGSLPQTYVYTGTPDLVSQNSAALTLSMCLPRAAYAGYNTTAGQDCRQLQGSALAASLAMSLAEMWAVPPAAVFLRWCMDLPWTNTSAGAQGTLPPGVPDQAMRRSWTYGDTSNAVPADVDGVYYSLYHASNAWDCNCSTLLGFSLTVAVALPGQAATAAARAEGLSAFSYGSWTGSEQANRAQTAIDMIGPALYNGSAGLTVAFARAGVATASHGSTAAAYPRIASSCAASLSSGYVFPVYLDACVEQTTADDVLSKKQQNQRNAATGCGKSVWPPGGSGGDDNEKDGLPTEVTIAIGSMFGVVICGLASFLYARWRLKRVELVKALQRQQAKDNRKRLALARAQRLGTLAPQSASQAAAPPVITPERLPVHSLGGAMLELGANSAQGASALAAHARAAAGGRAPKLEFGPTNSGANAGSARHVRVDQIRLAIASSGSSSSSLVQSSPQPRPQPVEAVGATSAQATSEDGASVPGVGSGSAVLNPLAAAAAANEGSSTASTPAYAASLPGGTQELTGLTDQDAAQDGIGIDPSVGLEAPGLLDDESVLAPARAPILSTMQQVMELLAPGSATFGVGLLNAANAPAVRHLNSQQDGPEDGMDHSGRGLALPDAVRVLRQVETVETVQLRPVSWVRGREAADLESVRNAIAMSNARAAFAGEAGAADGASAPGGLPSAGVTTGSGSTEATIASRPQIGLARQFSIVKRSTVVDVQQRATKGARDLSVRKG